MAVIKIHFMCYFRGNYEGQSPYSTGTSCSACPSSYPHCVHGTCSDSKDLILHPMKIIIGERAKQARHYQG